MKAFDVTSLVEHLPGAGKVVSLASWEENLYVGTSDGSVLLYRIEKASDSLSGVVSHESYLELKSSLGHGKKNVEELLVIGELQLLLALCDGNLSFLNMNTLKPSSANPSPIKGVTRFCPDSKGPLYRLCLAMKKRLQLYEFVGSYVLYRELQIPDPVMAMQWYGNTICLAFRREYNIINLDTGKGSELFPIEKSMKTPFIKLLPHEELLISVVVGSENLGMFINFDGSARRQNLRWSQAPSGIMYSSPYIIALLPKCLEIHTKYDQNLLQTISMSQGCAMCETPTGTFVATPGKISVVTPMPIETQVDELLKARRIKEAVELVTRTEQESLGVDYVDSEDDALLTDRQRVVHGQAAWVMMEDLLFKEAAQHFAKSSVDPQDLLSLFPSLSTSLPPDFTPKHPFGATASVISFAEAKDYTGERAKKAETDAKKAIVSFLEEWLQKTRIKKLSSDTVVFVTTQLLKIHAETDVRMAEKVLGSPKNPTDKVLVDEKDLSMFLEKLGKYSILALLNSNLGRYNAALDIWKKMGDGTLKEDGCNGIEETIALLSRCDPKLVWEYAPWVIEKDSDRGIAIFTERDDNVALDYDEIVEFLGTFQDSMSQAYLEHLVHKVGVKDAKYHTQLALRYLDTVLMLIPDDPVTSVPPGQEAGLLGQVRTRLLRFLEESDCYNVPALLGKIRSSNLHHECALLYAKMGQHELALRRLVYDLSDFEEAERYCERHSKLNEKKEGMMDHESQDRDLFLVLLDVTLHPQGSTVLDEKMLSRATGLLNKYTKRLAVSQVLGLIPSSLPISVLADYFMKAIPASAHLLYDNQIVRNVSKQDNLQTKCMLATAQTPSVVVTKDVLCPVCSKRIQDKVFARFPNGVIVHYNCLHQGRDGERDRNVCPVTHIDFRTGEMVDPDTQYVERADL